LGFETDVLMLGDMSIGHSYAGLAPHIMGIGPTIAIPKVLTKVGLRKEDVDLFEVCMKSKEIMTRA